MAAYAEAFGAEPRVVAVDGAAMPVLGKRRGPFRAAALPPLAPVWQPVLASVPPEAETHARTSPLDRLLAALDGESHQSTLALDGGDLRPYLWAGWTVTPRSTYRLVLGVDLEAGFSPAVRRTIRKEAEAVEIVEDAALAGDAVRLMIGSYRRGGADLGLAEGALVRLAEAFGTAGLARTFAARRGGATEAALVAAHDGRTAYYWIAGSAPGPAMTVLLAHVLGRLAEAGAETFDLCGANVPSIAEFKRRFGPALAPAPLARRASHPALRLLGRLRP